MPTMPLCLKSRNEWFASLPSMNVPMLPVPVSHVLINYTRKKYRIGKTSPGPRPNKEQIISELVYLQRGDMHKLSDIRYNFMIGPDGCVYEGRGWISSASLPLKYRHLAFKALYIGYIGNYTEMYPPNELFEARDELLKFGVENNFISKRFLCATLSLPEYFKHPFKDYLGN